MSEITTVRELMEHYIENHEFGIKQNTIDCWLKPGLTKFEKWLERPALISDLTLKNVNSYIDWLKAKSSSSEASRSKRGPWLKDESFVESPAISLLQNALEYFHSMRARA